MAINEIVASHGGQSGRSSCASMGGVRGSSLMRVVWQWVAGSLRKPSKGGRSWIGAP